MDNILVIATIWLGLAVLAAVIAYHIRVSIALVEICLGIVVAAVASALGMTDQLGANQQWLQFLASAGAILLTFLAGAELDPRIMRTKIREVTAIGFVSFLAPFLGCTALAHYMLGWDARASWLCGIALSATSLAIVYAVMLETGFNKTSFGKGILGSCFVNNLFAVLTLGLIFAPFTIKTLVFLAASIVVIALLPYITSGLTAAYGHRTAAIRTKWVLFVLFGLGALAIWSGSEAVLPAYISGMVLAGSAARDSHWVRRFRTLTMGFLTPFYFIRAGALVSLGSLLAAPLVLALLFASGVIAKIIAMLPVIRIFHADKKEKWYYTMMMTTNLTFGTIFAVFGLSNGVVTEDQYSLIVGVVICCTVLPTIVAAMFFLPRHLLPKKGESG